MHATLLVHRRFLPPLLALLVALAPLLPQLVPVSPALAATCVTPPAAMASWWPGDGNARDIMGGSHGTLRGGTAFAAGKVGQAFSLDGVNDEVRVADHASLNPTKLTIEAWIKPAAIVGTLVKKPGNDDSGYALENAPQLRLVLRDATPWTRGPGASVPLNTWSHVGRHL